MKKEEQYMQAALEAAQLALVDGEVPVGCIICNESGTVIGVGRNRREKTNLATAHAEIEAIESACRSRGSWRLDGCSLFVTLEPCPMCAGAIINSRISNVYFGAKEPISGSCGSIINLFMENYKSSAKIVGGILEEECSALLMRFFKEIRNK